MKNRDCELVKPCGGFNAAFKGVENSDWIIPNIKTVSPGCPKKH